MTKKSDKEKVFSVKIKTNAEYGYKIVAVSAQIAKAWARNVCLLIYDQEEKNIVFLMRAMILK